ncbi:acyltransferase [Halobacillus salinarum]|uniref:Acyltransferase n=1 Tax=Halobacillus salinarum TaxID=2932257 RepID=A0ABY4ELQ4_9BACI|nr:acyltransferase [Halobacillus salinarum]UOQ45384.1 acyltransferase [Halobacillus salinarum]
MNFERFLDLTLGPRYVLHVIECSVCSFDEVYYSHPVTHKTIGRACSNCQFLQVFEPSNPAKFHVPQAFSIHKQNSETWDVV